MDTQLGARYRRRTPTPRKVWLPGFCWIFSSLGDDGSRGWLAADL